MNFQRNDKVILGFEDNMVFDGFHAELSSMIVENLFDIVDEIASE